MNTNPNLIINSLLARIFTEYPEYPWTAIITETRIDVIDSFVRLQELIKAEIHNISVTLKTEDLTDISHYPASLQIQILEFNQMLEFNASTNFTLENPSYKRIQIEDFTFIIMF